MAGSKNNLSLVRGQAIVEILVALSVAVLVIVALVSLVVTALASAKFSRSQGEATRAAREGMEWLRGERDRDFSVFAARSGNTWCVSSLSWPASAGVCQESQTIANTQLRREAVLTQISASDVEARVIVIWNDPKGAHEVRLNQRFTKWK